MTEEQKRQLELLKELEELENKEVEAEEIEIINEEEFEELEEIQTNIIFEEEYKIKVKQKGKFKLIELAVKLSDVDYFIIKEISEDFEHIANGKLRTEAIDEFFSDCVVMKEYETGIEYTPRTTKEKFMLITAILKKVTPSIRATGNRQQRRAAQRKHKNK